MCLLFLLLTLFVVVAEVALATETFRVVGARVLVLAFGRSFQTGALVVAATAHAARINLGDFGAVGAALVAGLRDGPLLLRCVGWL